MTNLTVLVVGSGGREHALVWKLRQSARVGRVFCAPGNGGTAALATNVAIGAEDVAGLLAFAQAKAIDLTVVGPEVPLALGIVDVFNAAGLAIFGPSQAAAQLESSKAFAKAFMAAVGIPTAGFGVFARYDEAVAYVRERACALVVKASGLAGGKGVVVCDSAEEAERALGVMMREGVFGPAGDEVVIEERLSGPEVSLLAFCDGKRAVLMLPARDHKRAYDGDGGPNTGGMGAVAPPPDVDGGLVEEVRRRVIEPTLAGMAERGMVYVGVLYVGVMVTPAGIKVLEFNCRFGDPETQVVLPMLEGDLAEIMLACVEGRLEAEAVGVHGGACAAVVMAAPGYPGSYPKGLALTGLAEADELEGVMVFQAGTKRVEGQLQTSGGRVLAVSARADGLDSALARAYEGVGMIGFEGAHFRKDIGIVNG